VGVFSDLQGTGKNRASDKGRESKKTGAGVSSINEKKKTSKRAAVVTLNNNHVEKMRGDVITAAGVSSELLPVSVEDIPRKLGAWVETWQAAQAVPDIRKASPLLFNSLCTYIGQSYIKPSRILKDTKRTAAGACVASTCNRYNPASVAAAFDIFAAFCSMCDKIPFQNDFAAFCGVSVMYIREYVQGLTSAGLNLAKKTRETELQAIRQAASRDPVGRLAILNNEYWCGGMITGQEQAASGQALPTAGAFSLVDHAPID